MATTEALTESQRRGALTHPDVEQYSDVNRDVLAMLSAPGRGGWVRFGLAVLGVILFFGSWFWQIYRGIGVSGLTSPVGWGAYITTFVFWVGIAHSGTLISAILFLFRAPWRQSVYRSAEAEYAPSRSKMSASRRWSSVIAAG